MGIRTIKAERFIGYVNAYFKLALAAGESRVQNRRNNALKTKLGKIINMADNIKDQLVTRLVYFRTIDRDKIRLSYHVRVG